MPNRSVFELKVYLKTNVIATDIEEAKLKLTEHLRQHPERLLIKGKEVTMCDLLEEWEVGNKVGT